MIVNQKTFSTAIKKLQGRPLVFDIETGDLKIMYGTKICGIGVGNLEGDTFYFPIRHPNKNIKYEQYQQLLSVLESCDTLIAHNIKFDTKGILRDGVKFNRNWSLIDTQVMMRLVNHTKTVRVALSEAIEFTFGAGNAEYKDVPKEYLKKNKLESYSDIPVEIMGPYCILDVEWTRKIFFRLWQKLIEQGQSKIWQFEIDTTRYLLEIEYTGARFDRAYCERGISLLRRKMGELEKKAYAIAGKEFNVGSSKQLNEVFKSLGKEPVYYTDKGAPKWDAVALFLTDHELAKILLNWRSLAKLDSTYFSPLLDLPSDIIYCSFKNWRTITGRLSSAEPNLQNIPRTTQKLDEISLFDDDDSAERMKFAKQWAERGIKSGKAKSRRQTWEIYEEFDEQREDIIAGRRLFIPREGYTLFAIDFAQMEMIVFLSYINSPRIKAMISDRNFDIHTYIAKEAYGVNPDNPDFKFFRQVSKEISYGIIYGMGLETLAAQMGTEIDKAREFRNKYYEIIPEAKDFMKIVARKIESGKPIHNRYNRQYYIDPQKSYLGVNYLVQGTSAEIVKERMMVLSEYFNSNNLKTKTLIQVHDEFIIEVHNSEFEHLPQIVKMIEDNSIGIPLKAEISECCPSWIQKKKIKDINEYTRAKLAQLPEMQVAQQPK